MEEISKETIIIQSPRKKVKYTSDWTLWACYIILVLVSIVEVFSANSLELKQGSVYLPITSHVQFLLLGMALMLLLERIHYKYFKVLMLIVVPLAILGVIMAFFIGENINGAVRSIKIGDREVQVAEMSKLASAMLLAYIFARFQKPNGSGLQTKGICWGIAVIGLFAGLLLTQGASNALLVVAVGVVMLILAGLPRSVIYAGSTVAVICIIVFISIYISLLKAPATNQTDQIVATTQVDVKQEKDDNPFEWIFDKLFGRSVTWRNRILDWLPGPKAEYEKDTTYTIGGNSQKHHAYMAIANGHGIGVMPGNSRECSRLQLAFSDYIYAIILEELGLFGGIVVLLCYLGIVIRATMIGRMCKSAYASFLMVGMSLLISVQAFYHMCISVGLLPVTGQPLPFISKGGVSILVMSIAMGIMLSVSRAAVERTSEGLKTINDDDELPQDLKANNPAGIF